MKILVAGGTGLVGQVLCRKLISLGHTVFVLSRHPKPGALPLQFYWNIEKGEINTTALEGVEVIVNLAGAGVADKRWSTSYKKEILESRTKSAQLLIRQIKASKNTVKAYISASATGYYGFDTASILINEGSKKGSDFLANVVDHWEKEALEAEKLGIRTVCLRTGIVLSSKGGALSKLVLPIRYLMGSPFGSGNQYFSWIDIEDLVNMYVFSIENKAIKGIYNAVAPIPITNKELTQAIALQLNAPLWAPNVPRWALNVAVGELANTLVGGNRVSSEKIEKEGFVFRYPTLVESLKEQLNAE